MRGLTQDKPLTKRQRRIVDELKDYAAQFNRWDGLAGEQLEAREDFRQFVQGSGFDDWHKVELEALRAGLESHPLVTPWLRSTRALGAWNLLRKAKTIRAESGVRRPQQIDERLRQEIIRLASAGKTWGATRKELIANGWLPSPYSRNAFYELRQRLSIPSRRELSKM